MMKNQTIKSPEAVLARLNEQWVKACSDYLLELANMWDWDLDSGNGYWIDGEGTIYSYGEYCFVGMDDMRYIVENGVSYEEYIKWQDYNSDADEFGFNHVKLKAWCQGCPRVSNYDRSRIKKMKSDLMKEIEKEKEKLKNGKANPY